MQLTVFLSNASGTGGRCRACSVIYVYLLTGAGTLSTRHPRDLTFGWRLRRQIVTRPAKGRYERAATLCSNLGSGAAKPVMCYDVKSLFLKQMPNVRHALNTHLLV